MSAASVFVLTLMASATALLAYRSCFVLPKVLADRMRDSAQAFGTAIELRFPSHEGLMRRVITLSDAMARQIGLTERQRRDLEMAGRLRDIGLCSIPYRLVNGMPYSDWNLAEKATYFQHAQSGAAMLELLPELCHLAPIVRHHHSRADTPLESIPVEARILRVAVDYVWHERAQGDLLAREMLRDGRGSSYCPQAVDAILAVLTSARVERREPCLV